MIDKYAVNDRTVTICTINGQQCRYDVCDGDKIPLYDGWIYLGQGTIYSVDGIAQNSQRLLHFWRKPNK